jgi:lipopolysaccharide/colanic/teichoic acid biosynthesis glycosyltransferase
MRIYKYMSSEYDVPRIMARIEGTVRSGPAVTGATGALSAPTRPVSALKLAFDYSAAVVLLIATLPLVVVAMILVKITSRGPAIFRQTRVGLGGHPFTIYKIRTMRHDCERGTGPRWSIGHDPRVTWIGRWLRRTHVDELPQLWNVLRGEMSIVGPRPERPEIVAWLEQEIPHYEERLLVRPGVTGLAQLQLPSDVDVESVRRKLLCDLHYIRLLSLGLDMRIVLGTLAAAIGVPFLVSRKVLRIPSGTALEATYRGLSSPEPLALPAQVQTA